MSIFEEVLAKANKEYWANTSDLSFVKDKSGVYLRTSMPFVEMVGKSSPDEIIGKTDYDIFEDKTLAERYMQDDRNLIESGESLLNYVEPITEVDGRPRYGLTSKFLLRDEENKIIGILGLGRDITLEYEAKQAYNRELMDIFTLPEDSPIAGLFDITAWRVVDVRFRHESEKLAASLNTIDKFFSNIAKSVVDDEDTRAFFENLSRDFLLNQFRKGKRKKSLEFIRRRSDGEERWVREDLYFLIDPTNGNLVMVMTLHDIDEKKKAYKELIYAAERDSITGLYNRDTTVKQIEKFLMNARGTQALLMLDLDNFKAVNDNFGHQYGDNILAQVGNILKSAFRTSDIVGRIGGDEFMALMKSVPYPETIIKKAGELVSSLQFQAKNNNKSLDITVSVGVTIFEGDTADFETIYAEADTALYKAKEAGKNRFVVFGYEASESEGAVASTFEKVSTVQLQTLLEYMDGGLLLAEVTDKIIIKYASPSLKQIFKNNIGTQSSFEEVFKHIVKEDYHGLQEALINTAKSDDKVLDYSYRIEQDREIQWHNIRAKRVPSEGDGIDRIVAVITEISDLKHANESLREAEERYRIAMEQTDATLWEFDLADNTLLIIPSYVEKEHGKNFVFKNAPESYLETGRVHMDSKARFKEMFEDMRMGNDSDTYFFKVIYHGEECWVKDKFKILNDEKGNPNYCLGITQLVPNINTEMRSFEHEMQFAEIIKDSLEAFVCVNLTQDKIEAISMNDAEWINQYKGSTLNSFLDFVRKQFIVDADIENFNKRMSKKYFIDRFKDRKSWKFVDYKMHTIYGVDRWISIFINMMRHPISGDICAFTYVRDNDMRRNWELSFPLPLKWDTTSLLYAEDTMRSLSKHILDKYPRDTMVAVSVLELIGLDSVRENKGESEVSDILFTFGRICRIAISGNAIVGQLEENKVVFLRPNAENTEIQREKISNDIALLKTLINRAHPEANLSIIGGFAIDGIGATTYDQLLRKARLASRTASQVYGEAAVLYKETGIQIAANDTDSGLLEKYNELELRYQQQVNMLKLSEDDEITGLMGKQSFYRHVREVLDENPDNIYAIVRFDINRFKVYNDVNGTAAGDLLLKSIAKAIRREYNSIILSARLESDHFAVLMKNEQFLEKKLHKKFKKWTAANSTDFKLSFAIGIFVIKDTSLDIALMCDRALLAQKSAKNNYDSSIAFYDDDMRDVLLEEQQLLSEIDLAIQNNEFEIYFQPQINYENGALIGAEALVRWNHPTRGLLMPNSFIPLLEENGMINKLDEHVWDICCQYIHNWISEYPQVEKLSISMSVNVSRIDIYDEKLCEKFVALVEKYNLPPSMLSLEITESAYMDSPQQLIATVYDLQSAGFTVEMDDFGSGYSSLNTLKDVYVDILKLDMKFLEEGQDKVREGNILGSVIRMAHWLELPIIAEGVETKAQADYLKSLGCVYMQGYYFAKPMPASEFKNILVREAIEPINRYSDTNFEGMAAFWDPSAQIALLFNSFVGGAAIMEYINGRLEASRVNENFYAAIGSSRDRLKKFQRNMLGCFDDENKEKIVAEINKTISTGEEAGCEVCAIPSESYDFTWLSIKLRLLAKNLESAILYVAVENIDERKNLELERERLLMVTWDRDDEFIYVVDPESYEVAYTNEAIKKDANDEFIGKICYKAFMERDTPCDDCPLNHINDRGKMKLLKITKPNGVTLISHAVPIKWLGKDMAMMSCIDADLIEGR